MNSPDLFSQNASLCSRFQFYIDDEGYLWVTNIKKGDKPTKKLDADKMQKQIFTNKKTNH